MSVKLKNIVKVASVATVGLCGVTAFAGVKDGDVSDTTLHSFFRDSWLKLLFQGKDFSASHSPFNQSILTTTFREFKTNGASTPKEAQQLNHDG